MPSTVMNPMSEPRERTPPVSRVAATPPASANGRLTKINATMRGERKSARLGLHVNLRPDLLEFLRLLPHPRFNRGLFIKSLFRREIADVLRDFHRAEVRAAHRAEVGLFRAFLRQRLVVEFARGFGVERE